MARLRIPSGGVLLFAAVVIGAGSTIGTAAWLRQQEQESEQAAAAALEEVERKAPVVVARSEIAAGTVLTAPMLTVIELPASTLPPGAITDMDDAVGNTLRYPLATGEQLLQRKLIGDGPTGTGLAFAIPAGMRAVSVAFSEVMGAGGLVVPGDRVDVLVATSYERLFEPSQRETLEEDDADGHPTVITLLQDVLVLAVGQETTPPVTPEADAASTRKEDAPVQPGARSVTLAITPTQAQTLFMATQEGTLGLALRAFGDDSQTVLNPELKLEPSTGVTQGLTASQ